MIKEQKEILVMIMITWMLYLIANVMVLFLLTSLVNLYLIASVTILLTSLVTTHQAYRIKLNLNKNKCIIQQKPHHPNVLTSLKLTMSLGQWLNQQREMIISYNAVHDGENAEVSVLLAWQESATTKVGTTCCAQIIVLWSVGAYGSLLV